MNKRILELAIQAEGTKKHVPAVWQFYDHELENFAKLIVKQCISMADEFEMDVNRSGLVDKMKEYFGVE